MFGRKKKVNKKVLIVEDDSLLLKVVSTSFLAEKFQVATVENGLEVLEVAKKFLPDIVLLDLMLPKKSGEDVLAEIKKDLVLKDIPVLVSTVKSDAGSVSRCVELGARGYFIKAHYTLDDISKEVKKVLAEK